MSEEFKWLELYCHKMINYFAFIKWETSGRPEGRDIEFWLAAEKEFYDGWLEGDVMGR